MATKKKAPPRPVAAPAKSKKKTAKKKTAKAAKVKANMPPLTESVVRGACASGATKWKDARKAKRECKASSADEAAFGEYGGKASAIARERDRIYMGRQVK